MNWIFWLIVIIVLTIVEVSTTNLVSIWFIVSALISLLVSFITENIIMLSSIFVIVGTILLITTKPLLDKLIKGKNNDTNLERIIGKSAIVTDTIDEDIVGEVKIDGKRWSAISNSKIEIGSRVKVLKIDGVKLIVEKESD